MFSINIVKSSSRYLKSIISLNNSLLSSTSSISFFSSSSNGGKKHDATLKWLIGIISILYHF
jgi:hypothetical protein